ncbi:MAG: hypothetical protein V1907_03760 [Candidatus Kerfeldbacteria bacterium]
MGTLKRFIFLAVLMVVAAVIGNAAIGQVHGKSPPQVITGGNGYFVNSIDDICGTCANAAGQALLTPSTGTATICAATSITVGIPTTGADICVNSTINPTLEPRGCSNGDTVCADCSVLMSEFCATTALGPDDVGDRT